MGMKAHALDTISSDISYLKAYEFIVKELKTSETDFYIRKEYKGSFKASQATSEFKDTHFVILTSKSYQSVKPQLTLVLPNLSPMVSIDEKIAQGLAKRGSDVILIKTGITTFNYFQELADFNHIIRQQILVAHHTLNFALSTHHLRPEQVQVLGVSLGGLLSAIMLSIDDRISSGITLMAGAGYKDDEKLGIIADISRLLKGTTKTVSPGIALDPAYLPQGYAEKRSRLYMTLKDSFVPPKRQNDLKNLLKDPEVIILKGRHVKNALHAPRRVQEYFDFFNSK